MMEEAGIRNIPISKRKRIRGYKKTQEQLTYHHIQERSNGGPATEENGAILKEYNHAWLHKQSPETIEAINQKLQEYKATISASILQTSDSDIEQSMPIELSFDTSDCITIPAYDTEPKEKKNKFNRAKVKQETKEMIEEYEEDLIMQETKKSAKDIMLDDLSDTIREKSTTLYNDETISLEDKLTQADILLNMMRFLKDYDENVAILDRHFKEKRKREKSQQPELDER